MPAPILENQLETRLDDVQATIPSLVEAPKHHRRGPSKTERRATYDREENSVPRSDKNSIKGESTSAARPNTCKYKHCMRPTTHKTEDCLSAKLAAIIGAGP